MTNAGSLHFKGLTAIKGLVLSDLKVSDAGLVNLKGLTTLQDLDLRDLKVSDAGLVNLNGLHALGMVEATGRHAGYGRWIGEPQWIDGDSSGFILGNTNVTDAGLVHLKGFASLGSCCQTARGPFDGLENLKGIDTA